MLSKSQDAQILSQIGLSAIIHFQIRGPERFVCFVQHAEYTRGACNLK